MRNIASRPAEAVAAREAPSESSRPEVLGPGREQIGSAASADRDRELRRL